MLSRHAPRILLLSASAALLAGCSGPFFERHLGRLLFPSAAFQLENRSCTLALTIDDSPDPSGRTTATIAEVLERYGATATFFVIGERVTITTRPLLEQLLRQGHELGNHGFEEARAVSQTSAEFEASVAATHELLTGLAEATGTAPPRWFRPGWGVYNRRMQEQVSTAPFGYRIALGDVFPRDTEHCSVARSARYIVRHARPGSIVVLHDADTTPVLAGADSKRCDNGLRGDRTAAVLDAALPLLAARGFRVAGLTAAAAAPPAGNQGCRPLAGE